VGLVKLKLLLAAERDLVAEGDAALELFETEANGELETKGDFETEAMGEAETIIFVRYPVLCALRCITSRVCLIEDKGWRFVTIER